MKYHRHVLNKEQFTQLCKGETVIFTTSLPGSPTQGVKVCLADIGHQTMKDIVKDASYKTPEERQSDVPTTRTEPATAKTGRSSASDPTSG